MPPVAKTIARPAVIGATLRVPFECIPGSRRKWMEESLTFTPAFAGKAFAGAPPAEDGEEEEPEPIRCHRIDHEAREVHLPLAWGLRFLALPGQPEVEWNLDLSVGAFAWEPPRLPDPNHPKATAGQEDFVNGLIEEVTHRFTALGEAPTGSGKTVSALSVIGQLGCPALVIVPSRGLADQWRIEAKLHLGLTDDDLGLIQGDRADWAGKKIVFAVIHNLYQKEFAREFYRAFGTVVADEAHRLGAPEFAKALPLFPARYRIALTATPDRKDGCMGVVTAHMGEVSVRLQGEALATECRVIHYNDPAHRKIAQLPLPTILGIISKSAARNAVIIDAVLTLWKAGRKVLVISDRVEHLQTLQKMAIKAGIPEGKTALYVGSYKAGGKTKKTGEGYLRMIRENAEYECIFGTYAQMKEGTNIPRLDAGIDALPRAEGTQTIGRIRRPFPGKPKPVWFTIVDEAIPILTAFSKARLRDYENSNVTIIR